MTSLRPLRICVFLLLITHLSMAQVIGPEVYTDPSHATITRYVNVLKAGTLIPLDSVLSPAGQGQFVKAQKDFVVYSRYDSFYYWFRMVIRNDNREPADLRLLMAPVGMLDGRLYQKQQGHWQVIGQSGYKYAFIDRAYQYAHYVFPLTVPPQSTDTFYMSMDASHSFKSYGFALMQPKALKIFENQVYFKLGIIVGLLLLFCLFNLYLFFTLKDKIYAWYAAYICMLIVIVIKYDQLDQQFFGWDSDTAYHLTSIMGIAAYGIALLMHVIQQFLTVIEKKSFLYRLSTIVKWNAMVSGTAQLVTFYIKPDYHIQNAVFYWCNYATILTICVVIVDCFYSIYKGFRSAYFIGAGLLVFLIGAMQKLLLRGDSTSLFPPSVFHYGMVLETLIISFALIYQYRVERHEKLIYQKEKDDLQNNFDKLLLKSKIEIQEQTFDKISEEINDNIGQEIGLLIDTLERLPAEDPEVLDHTLATVKKQISKVNADLRDLSKSLDTDFVMQMGLVKSIDYEFNQLHRSGNCETALQIEGEPYPIDPQKELILFRLFQEIFNDMVKQATACKISVQLEFEPGLVTMKITNDLAGSGSWQSKEELTIRQRASLIGALFSVTNTDGNVIYHIALPATADAVV